ncbi:MAG: hypothetical protein AB7G25_04600 [Sphingomonadaceae bacterium]
MENSPNDKEASQTGLSHGISQMNEAIQHSLTASKLMWAGVFAIGAGAAAYFWDPKRREEFMDAARKWPDEMTKRWSGTTTEGDKQERE